MYYKIRHYTRYRYDAPIHENMMEARMKPRSDGRQSCHRFELTVSPRTECYLYEDFLGNAVHYFNIPGQHSQLTLTANTLVEVNPAPELPDSLPATAWAELDDLAGDSGFWEILQPSQFTRSTALLQDLAGELNLSRHADPLTLVRELNEAVYRAIEYTPDSTAVDSPIDEALASRQGVCQDFVHVMLALLRLIRMPCRYVSGYLFHRDDHDRSAEDATHAWTEVYLPGLGWVGFDPTNNLVVTDRHIRAAIGRDYADVPPTRGIFRGEAEATLTVGVSVSPGDAPADQDELSVADDDWHPPAGEEETAEWRQQQQQQQ
jgi:transglutaminase-like putative cysteine protease